MPAAHSVHAACALLGLYVPSWQLVHNDAPPLLNSPAPQALQFVDPLAAAKKPAAQSWQADADEAPAESLKVPAAQERQAAEEPAPTVSL